jgi:hypothetical protein
MQAKEINGKEKRINTDLFELKIFSLHISNSYNSDAANPDQLLSILDLIFLNPDASAIFKKEDEFY